MGLFRGITKAFKKVFGLDAGDDLAKQQEAALRKQAEQAKLDASNEIENVVRFDDAGDTGTSTDDSIRRKKKSSGGYASALGLNI